LEREDVFLISCSQVDLFPGANTRLVLDKRTIELAMFSYKTIIKGTGKEMEEERRLYGEEERGGDEKGEK
jgi:hypothetical protein